LKYLKIQKNHKKEKENKSYFDIVAICNFAQNFWKAEIDSSFGENLDNIWQYSFNSNHIKLWWLKLGR